MIIMTGASDSTGAGSCCQQGGWRLLATAFRLQIDQLLMGDRTFSHAPEVGRHLGRRAGKNPATSPLHCRDSHGIWTGVGASPAESADAPRTAPPAGPPVMGQTAVQK